MLATGWKDALVDIDRAVEFSGDDVDRYSKLVDLGKPFEFLTVIVPTLDSSAVTPYIQKDSSEATVPTAVHHFHDTDADTNVIQSTAASTGGYAITFNIGGAQYLRIYCGANQTADRTFSLRGFNR